MFKGKKSVTEGNNKNIDNWGDGIYGLIGKSKAEAKKSMHKITRFRAKAKLKKELKEI